MSDDLDFRPETLEPGDQLRWMNVWRASAQQGREARTPLLELPVAVPR